MLNPIAIASGVSGAYALPLAVTLRSVLSAADRSGRFVFYVLDGGISATDRAKVESVVAAGGARLTWLRPDPDHVSGLPLRGGMSPSTYYRLLLADALPRSLKKVIWLDADVLVLRDLGALDEMDAGPCPILAATDMVIPRLSSPLGVPDWQALGLPADGPHFNAGVMVINLERWRDEHIGDQALAYLRRYAATVALWDQEALNAVLAGRWAPLDGRWNRIASVTGRRFSEVAGTDAWIYHFAGDWKPWTLPYGRHPYELFYRHLDQTPFAGWRPRSSLSRRGRAFYHEHLRDLVYPIERAYTNLRFGRLLR